MADKTGIEWTDATWNPIVGCSVVSPGCTNCYAMKMAARIERMTPGTHYAGTTHPGKGGPVWTGKLALAPEHILTQPLRWSRPRRIFVNSMGDLFHKDVPDAWLDRVFAVAALCPHHTLQVLTKRSARMRAYCSDLQTPRRIGEMISDMVIENADGLLNHIALIAPCIDGRLAPARMTRIHMDRWPLRNCWLGVSAEDQRRADERVPDLLATPAAVRFLSAEPLLSAIDFRRLTLNHPQWSGLRLDALTGAHEGIVAAPPYQPGFDLGPSLPPRLPGLDWLICGGESGPNARPMDLAWARAIVKQCQNAGVACFVKQMGTHPVTDIEEQRAWVMRDKKGGDPSEWPEDLRVQEMPHA